MITLANLEDALGDDDQPFFFFEEPDSDDHAISQKYFTNVCCLAVELDLSDSRVVVTKHWVEGPEIASDLSGYVFLDRMEKIFEVHGTDLKLEHAEIHGFEPTALLVLHGLFSAYQAQWYGANSGEDCQSSTEDDLRWLKFFVDFFSKIARGDCDCGMQALGVVNELRDYAKDLNVKL